MRYLILLVLIMSSLYSSVVLDIKKGWQLIGFSQDVTDFSQFSSDKVEILWTYDSKNKQWSGYSADADVMAKVESAGYGTVSEIKKWHGVWISSKEDWRATFEKTSVDTTSKEEAVTLENGWNLISMPVNSVVSPKVFGDSTIWKYSNGEWQFSESDSTSDLFPEVDQIGNSEGFWVYSEESKTIDFSEEEGKLVNFDSLDDVKSYVEKMYLSNANNYMGYYVIDDFIAMPEVGIEEVALDSSAADDSAISSDGGSNKAEVSDTTDTNLQEAEVDEADVLKHDGENIFFVDSNRNIYFTKFTNLVNGDFNQTGVVPTNSNYTINSMHISGNSLIVIYYSGYSEKTYNSLIESFDISDINNITKTASYSYDGSVVSTRVVDGSLYLISTFYPIVNYEYPKLYVDSVDTECKQMITGVAVDGGDVSVSSSGEEIAEDSDIDVESTKETMLVEPDIYYPTPYICYGYYYDKEAEKFYRYDYSNPTVTAEKLLPTLTNTVTSEETTLITPSKFYAPLKMNQTANVSTVLKFNTSDLAFQDSVSIVGNMDTIYASTNAIYAVSSGYGSFFDFWNYESKTAIYKFNIGENLEYSSNGFLDGRILNQFSLSEYNNNLRVATTKGFSWSNSGTDNSISVLKEENGALVTSGTLSGLGKEGEEIKAVRFLGDKGFVVTFLTTDPLYTLDLSDPTNPTKVGELEITGFSEYFHPIDDSRIMSIGRSADSEGNREGLMVELFDISDFANPVLAHKKTITESSSSYSEAEYNHKAFIYRDSDSKFAFPISEYVKSDASEWGYQYNNYLKLLYVDNLEIKEIGDLALDKSSNEYYGSSRGIIFTYGDIDYGAYFNGSNFVAKKISEISGE